MGRQCRGEAVPIHTQAYHARPWTLADRVDLHSPYPDSAAAIDELAHGHGRPWAN